MEDETPSPAPVEQTGPQVRPAVFVVIGVLTLIWGTTYFVLAEGLRDLPPFTSVAVRFLFAAAIFAALAAAFGRREGGRAPGLRLALVQGVFNLAVPYAVVYWSETILPSGIVSVLWGVFPMFVAVVSAALLPSERLGRKQWLGLLLGVAGLLVLFRTDFRDLGPESVRAGLVVLIAPGAASIGQVLVKRAGSGVSSLRLNAGGMWVAALVLCALALGLERDASVTWTPRAIASVVYLVLFGTVVTFGLYFWALRHAPAYLLSLVAYTTPVIALTVGAVLGDEPVTAWTLTGMGLILSGVTLVLRRRRATT